MNMFKQFVVELVAMVTILFGAILVVGPTAGIHSIAYKISMFILMGI